MGSECQSRKIAGNVSAPVDVCVCVCVCASLYEGRFSGQGAGSCQVEGIEYRNADWSLVCVCVRVCVETEDN